MRRCDTCGCYGHNAVSCGLKSLQRQQDPYGKRVRPKPKPISDPAMRDAGPATLFLLSGRER